MLKIFALAFTDEQFSAIPNVHFMEKVNLSTLNVGEFQNNQLCEHRIYLSDLPNKSDAEYIGFTTWRWNEKYQNILRHENLDQLQLYPNNVYCAQVAPDWASYSCLVHLGMKSYLEELSEYTKLPILYDSVGFWSNNFICHKMVYLEFQHFFRDACSYFHHKYGFNYKFEICDKDLNRHAGAFYERFSSFYFSNRHDLKLVSI